MLISGHLQAAEIQLQLITEPSTALLPISWRDRQWLATNPGSGGFFRWNCFWLILFADRTPV